MNLPELLSKVPCLKGYFDPETGEPLPGAGDKSCQSILLELSETFEPAHSNRRQLEDAFCGLRRLAALADDVANALESIRWALDEDQELEQAQAALADARANGTIAWEECKAALGLGQKPGYVVDGYDTRAKVLHEGDLHYLTPNQIKYSGSIGKLLEGGKFVCHHCALTYDLVEENAVSVYPVNIIPYSQECHDCGKVIVKGWDCQLYDAPKSKWAVIRLSKGGTPVIDWKTLSADQDVALETADIDEMKYTNLGIDHPVIGVVAVEGGE